MFKWIDGNKTYIGMVAGGALELAVALHLVTWEQIEWLTTLVWTFTGIAVAHKGNKIINAIKETKTE